MLKLASAGEQTQWAIDSAEAAYLRKAGFFLHVSNLNDFGIVVDNSMFQPWLPFPELGLVEKNGPEWEALYLHENYVNFKLYPSVREHARMQIVNIYR